MRPPLVILAGGAARRMGGGLKGLLPLGDTTLIGSALARLAPQAEAVALNANDPGLEAMNLPILRDTVPGRPGPLAGVLAAMRWAGGLGAARVATAAADTPFPPKDLLARLAEARAPVAMAATSDPARGRLRHPVFALWDVTLAEALEEALERGTRRVVAFADAHGNRDVDFPDEATFFNVNTPEDLVAARRMLP
ncbi:molybdenum cofactor guanylyltransferase [Hasllibacter halocynthiae]|uniref:Molybdenum cofactor guanylyltransferase n=1 Tax=Hasllibacter halocynthiae TaxID=595589 RepID=A0A2T0X3V6_9RHOB|nr:molybdenum cofactor guanylyltransferase MobA [Hasllibacter halocynthiae]PRY93621.1 molybdenum cofactor guanylyltransferase [Hasllibacter halocynthiae]